MSVYGNPDAPIVLVIEPKGINGANCKKLLWECMAEYGFGPEDCFAIYAYPTIPEELQGSDKAEAQWIADHRAEFLENIAKSKANIGIAMGKGATRACSNKAVAITRVRGQAWEYDDIPFPVLTVYSPNHVLRRPELIDIFKSDMFFLSRFADAGWTLQGLENSNTDTDYQWCEDLQWMIDNPPKALAVDTETTGLRWYKDEIKALTVQLCWGEGKAVAVPVDTKYWPMSRRKRDGIIEQLKAILTNPKTKFFAHNSGYDGHILNKMGIDVKWWMDTMILAFAADDNMTTKSQDECVRRWVPEMSGYADAFNKRTDKSNMRAVTHDDMLDYGCGDADALFRLCKVLVDVVRQDPKQWNLVRKVQMPALNSFTRCVERFGVGIDLDALTDLQEALDIEFAEKQEDLLLEVPANVRRKHVEKGLKFTRGDFVRDILFSKDGFNLTPTVFTKSTEKKPPSERVPSTSTKDHLPYFDDHPWVAKYIEFSKLTKMRSTYVGRAFDPKKNGPTGFFQYEHHGRIYPSFQLHNTVTGRTSSRDPNAQNIPKRGRLANAFRSVFVPTEGFSLVETDLSQAELRVAAWMANEKNMLRIYREDGDIHSYTAAAVLGVTYDQLLEWGKDGSLARECDYVPNIDAWVRTLEGEELENATVKDWVKLQRFKAKAVNFGFLYGMGWRGFMVYAKTDYGLVYTEDEAQHIRETFFRLYPALRRWHSDMENFVRENGYVRGLHGALRRLPSVYSSDEKMQWAAIRQAVNSPVQRFASDLGLITLARIEEVCPKDIIRPVMFIHDALIFEVRNDKLEEYQSYIRWFMESNPLDEMFDLHPPIPIKADVSVGPTLSNMDEIDVEAIKPEWAY